MLDRRTLLQAAAALPLAGCAGQLAPARTLRVATFNIWHDAGNLAARRPLLIEALRRVDADAILLQEVLQDSRKGLPNQAETLAAALGGYRVHFSSTSPEAAANRYGNAILTRLPIVDTSMRKLEPLNDYRTALRVRVQRESAPVDLVCTHLAYQLDAAPVRARQVADLLAWLPSDGTPLVLGGDFNALVTESSLDAVRARGLLSALPPGAAATTLNTARNHAPRVIDHIFHDRTWRTREARVFGDAAVGGEYPSDHFGVLAVLG